MLVEVFPCPICGVAGVKLGGAEPTRRMSYSCERCGDFKATYEFARTPPIIPDDLRPYLSAATRQASKRGQELELTTGTWRELAETQKAVRIPEKLNRLLRIIAEEAGGPGGAGRIFPSADYPLVSARGAEELRVYIDYLIDKGLVTRVSSDVNLFHLSIEGWQTLEPTVNPAGIPGRCFVAMAFDPELEDTYQRGIEPAIRDDCKFSPHRMDKIEHNEKICDKIIADIRACQFMVADFTRDRGGIYFEAGFAMALGRPVIWTCREKPHDTLHFDTRQYNHIHWTSPEDLRKKLAVRIRATIPGANGE